MSEQINFDAELLRQLDREPFQPFSIVLASGDRYDVTDPHQVAMGQGSDTVVVLHPKTGISYFRKHLIVSVDVPQRGDAKPRRRRSL